MAATDLAARLEAALEPAAAEHGLELVSVEQAGGRHQPIIRVYLDRDGGIDIDTIAESNRWISDVLDASDAFTGPYVLEVSSPGIDRPLTKPEHFERFEGETATVKFRTTEGKGAVTGRILSAGDKCATLLAEDGEHEIAYEDMIKARLKGVVDFATGRSAQTR